MLADFKLKEDEDRPKNTRRNILTGAVTAIILIAFILALTLKSDRTAPSPYSNHNFEVTHNTTNNYIILDPKNGVPHQQTFIFLHGYTMNSQQIYDGWFGSGMRGIANGLVPNNTRVIIPQAPVIFNPAGNQTTTSWFPILDQVWNTTNLLAPNRAQIFNQTALLATRDMVLNLIEEERLKVPNQDSRRIFLGGFSQGCFMSNSVLVSYPGPDPLGGIVCTSGMIAIDEEHYNKTEVALTAQKHTPLLLYHGLVDPTVPIVAANVTYQYYETDLKKDAPQYLYEFHIEPTLVHTWSKAEWSHIQQWIKNKLPIY